MGHWLVLPKGQKLGIALTGLRVVTRNSLGVRNDARQKLGEWYYVESQGLWRYIPCPPQTCRYFLTLR